jgi:bridging integrator 3
MMQKTGQIERTVDREFAEEETKFKAFVRLPLHAIADNLPSAPVSRKSATHCRKKQRHILTLCEVIYCKVPFKCSTKLRHSPAMTAAQTRLANTIDVYYGAAHAYKRAVDDLDAGVARELVSPS